MFLCNHNHYDSFRDFHTLNIINAVGMNANTSAIGAAQKIPVTPNLKGTSKDAINSLGVFIREKLLENWEEQKSSAESCRDSTLLSCSTYII